MVCKHGGIYRFWVHRGFYLLCPGMPRYVTDEVLSIETLPNINPPNINHCVVRYFFDILRGRYLGHMVLLVELAETFTFLKVKSLGGVHCLERKDRFMLMSETKQSLYSRPERSNVSCTPYLDYCTIIFLFFYFLERERERALDHLFLHRFRVTY